MDFITAREFRMSPGKVWEKLAEEQELVVTRNGKPVAILAATTGHALEADLKDLHRRRFGRLVKEIREQARKRGTDKMTLEEINAEIEAARDERQRESGG